ncbi:MAG TPA: twin-arginine translocase subunit TatC [Candidatus Saccharimonadales bacterium]|nr:twin-arginine translocase subunit TatC [Candidatus Saccharimonadales bacterium]
MKQRAKKKPAQRLAKAKSEHDKLPLIEHLHELRRRLFYVAASVAVGSAIAYGLEQKLIAVLLRPSHGQKFIYTSPLGGMNFLFSVCLDLGLVVSTPIIIYQILAFMQPLMRDTTRKFLLLASGATGLVAIGGVIFGYFVGLPSALHFLLHQFTSVQIRPLITIQSYMQFVALYLFGSALMFQLPLILLFINRIKPLKPSKLFKYERHLIAGSFIIAFIMNPTPNIIGQLTVVVPMILTYQFGILLVWLVNRTHQPNWLEQLRRADAERQAERAARQLIPLAPAVLTPEYAVADDAETAQPPLEPDTTQAAAPAALPISLTTLPPRTHGARAGNPTRRSYVPLRGQLIQ